MRLKQLLVVILVSGSVGLGAELVFLGHFEEPAQFVPLVLIAAGLAAVAWAVARPAAAATTVLRVIAIAQVVGGMIGIALHYQSNVEFEREMAPDIAGYQLVREALSGAVPALAPGALVQLGLIGLAYTIQEKK